MHNISTYIRGWGSAPEMLEKICTVKSYAMLHVSFDALCDAFEMSGKATWDI